MNTLRSNSIILLAGLGLLAFGLSLSPCSQARAAADQTTPPSTSAKPNPASLSGDSLLAAGEQLLRSQAKAAGEEEELIITPITRPHPWAVPPGKVELVACRLGSAGSQSLARVGLTVLVDGKAVHETVAHYRLQRFADVLVASRDLLRGAALTPSDARSERRDVFSLGGVALCQPSELDGRRAARWLPAGAPLTDASTEPIPLVKKGQQVTVTVIAAGLTLSASALALEDGADGQTIRLRNPVSNQQFTARVVGEAALELRLK
jgi:flagella basal body P-ring formation protein FlgA